MKPIILMVSVLLALMAFAAPSVLAGDYTMTPDGSYVGGDSYTMAPDGSYVGGNDSTMTPDGSYVGSDDQ